MNIPKSKCLYCGHDLNQVASLYEEEEQPQAGDLTVCIRCANVLVFKDDLFLRKPTKKESLLFNNDRDIKKVKEAINSAKLKIN